MPTYTYNGDPGRYYPELALTVNPGDTAQLPANPDPDRWTPPDADQLPPPPPPESPDVPAPPADPSPATAQGA